MTAKYLLFILSLFLITKANGQIKTSSLGLRIGYVKNSYYDESINYKIYNGFAFNPYQVRYIINSERNTYIANLLYISNTLSPVKNDNLVISDNINYRSGTFDFTYLRQLFIVNEKLDFRIGSKLSASGYESKRLYKKAFILVMLRNQRTYDISFFSLYASGQIKYSVSKNTCFHLNFDFPFLALNLKNYNSKLDPFNQDLWLISMDKYAGFTSDLTFVKRFNRFSLEFFQAICFIKYKEPYSKRVLTNKIGIGLYYEF